MNDTGGEFSELVADTGTAATTYTDNTVAASTHYTYRIKAINEHGVSERSRWFHIETLEVPVPAKPTGLNATATHDQVALTWDDPGDYSITGYVILRRHRYDDPKGHFDELVADTGTAATTYTDDTVEDSTHYTYRIKAINEYGGERALRQVVLRRVLPELEVQRRLLVDDFQLVVELDHVLVRRLVGAVGMLSLVFLIPFRILVPVIEVLIQLGSVPVIHLSFSLVVILSSPAVFPGASQQCWRQISFIQVPSSQVSVQERGYELVSEVFGRTNVVIKRASICGRLLVDNIILSSMAPIIRMSL